MKLSLITSYTFDPITRELNINVDRFDIRKLYAIINVTQGIIIYATGNRNKGYTSINGSTVTLEYNTTSMDANDIIQIIYEDDYDKQLQDSILYFITSLVEKLPRVDQNDRQVVNVEQGTITVNSLPTLPILTNLTNVNNFSGGNTNFIPSQISNMGALHIYNNIIVS